MSEKNASQSQHYTDGWKKLWDENLARLAGAQEQGARLEAQLMDNLNAAVDQSATLARQTLAYATQLSAEWRKHSLEAARRMSDLFAARV